jgi:hypothetical protein
MSKTKSEFDEVKELNRVEAKGANKGTLKADSDKRELVKQNKEQLMDFIFGKSDVNPLDKVKA